MKAITVSDCCECMLACWKTNWCLLNGW